MTNSNYEQLIFIDDSGDPGFKINNGSSRFFVIACIIFDNKSHAERAGECLQKLKTQLGWRSEREFKFHRLNTNQKKQFFKTVRGQKFKVHAVVINKCDLKSMALKKGEPFYNMVVKEALDSYAGMHKAKVLLDGSGSRGSRRNTAAYLRKTVNKSGQRMVSFSLADSRDNILIQLADMVAGAIHAEYDPAKQGHNLLRIIRRNIEEVNVFSTG